MSVHPLMTPVRYFVNDGVWQITTQQDIDVPEGFHEVDEAGFRVMKAQMDAVIEANNVALADAVQKAADAADAAKIAAIVAAGLDPIVAHILVHGAPVDTGNPPASPKKGKN